MKENKTVRAIDLGYGNTKYIKDHRPGEAPVCASFKSISLPANDSALDVGPFERRDTQIVLVDGVNYEAGNDIQSALGKHYVTPLNNQSIHSPQYEVQMKASLLSMEIDHIDRLVLGTPVHLLPTFGQKLKEAYQGKITLNKEKSITIDEVIVVAQPLGGYAAFLDTLDKKLLNDLLQQEILVIDPGYYTFDWIDCKRFVVNEALSGSVEGGISAMLQDIADAISKDPDINPSRIPITNLLPIDEALYTGKFRFGTKTHSIKKHLTAAKHHFNHVMTVLLNTLPANNAIKHVVVIGGAAKSYANPIKQTFPDKKVHVANNPLFANVSGFQKIGTSMKFKEKHHA